VLIGRRSAWTLALLLGCASGSGKAVARVEVERMTPNDCQQIRDLRGEPRWCDSQCPCGGGARCCVGRTAVKNACVKLAEGASCPAIQ